MGLTGQWFRGSDSVTSAGALSPRFFLLLIVTLLMAGCAVCDPKRYTKTGTTIGVVAGTVGGAISGGSTAILLAAAEGTAGFYIGRSIDEFEAAKGPCVAPSEESQMSLAERGAVEELALEELSVEDLTATLIEDIGAEITPEATAAEPEVVAKAEAVTEDAVADELESESDLEALLSIPATAAVEFAADEPTFAAIAEDVEIELNRLYRAKYEHGDSALPTNFRTILDKVAVLMQETPQSKLFLMGHTDNTGTAEFNHFLSVWRAANAGVYVVEQGVVDSRVEVIGYGDTRPLRGNETSEGRLENRRVEIVVRPLDSSGEPIGEVILPDAKVGAGDVELKELDETEELLR